MEKESINEYNRLLNNLVRNDNFTIFPNFIKDNLNYNEFKEFYLNNVKKSTFLASILPSILFLIISLVSFTLLFIKDTNGNLGLALNNPSLRVGILFYSSLFLVLAVILLVRRFVLKIRVIKTLSNKKYGYNQISNEKYLRILKMIDNIPNN